MYGGFGSKTLRLGEHCSTLFCSTLFCSALVCSLSASCIVLCIVHRIPLTVNTQDVSSLRGDAYGMCPSCPFVSAWRDGFEQSLCERRDCTRSIGAQDNNARRRSRRQQLSGKGSSVDAPGTSAGGQRRDRVAGCRNHRGVVLAPAPRSRHNPAPRCCHAPRNPARRARAR